MSENGNADNVIPLDRIRRYRQEINRRKVGQHMHQTARFLLELSTVAAVLGRGLQFMSRELGYEPHRRRRVRVPDW